jgi:MFS family permease
MKRFQFSYSWIIVVIAALAMAATLPGRTHGLGLITTQLLEDLKLSDTSFATQNLVATLLGSLFCFPFGWMIDRWGVRIVCFAVVFALGLVTIAMSRVHSASIMFALIVLARGLGQSALSVISLTMIAKWFKQQPTAMGVYSILLTIFMAIGVVVVGDQVTMLGWRTAWMSAGQCLIGLSFVMLLAKNATKISDAAPMDSTSLNDPSASLNDALKTSAFWLFATSIAYFGLASAAISLFNQNILAEKGFDESIYQKSLVIMLFTGLVANIAAALLAKQMPLNWLLWIALTTLVITYAWFPFIQSVSHVFVYAVLNGLAGGMLSVLFFIVWSKAFGTANLGKIQGTAQMVTVLASAIGPLLISLSHDQTKSYDLFFFASAAMCSLFAVCAVFIRVPRPENFQSNQTKLSTS